MTADPLIPFLDASKIRVGPLALRALVDLCDDLVNGLRDHVESPLDVSDGVDGLQLRGGGQRHQSFDRIDRLGRGLRRFASFRGLDQKVDELPTVGHSLGNGDALQCGDVVGVSHFRLLTVARAVTRYVVGALLTALRQLHPRAWVRRAAETRPSGTTTNGGTR